MTLNIKNSLMFSGNSPDYCTDRSESKIVLTFAESQDEDAKVLTEFTESKTIETSTKPVKQEKADKKIKKKKIEKIIPPIWLQATAMTPAIIGAAFAESIVGGGSLSVLSVETLGLMSKNILRNSFSELYHKVIVIAIAILGAYAVDKTLESSKITYLTTAIALKTFDREFNKGLKDLDGRLVLGANLALSAGAITSSVLNLPAPFIAGVTDSLSTSVKHLYKRDPKLALILNALGLAGALACDLYRSSCAVSTVPIALSVKEVIRKIESWQTGSEDVDDEEEDAAIQEPAPLGLQMAATSAIGSVSYGLVFLAQKQALAILAILGACLDKGFGRMVRNIVNLKCTPVQSGLLSIGMGASGKILADTDQFVVSGFGVLTMALALVVFQQAIKNWQLGKTSEA